MAVLDASGLLKRKKAVRRPDLATQWTLMWWKFRQHRLAMVGMALPDTGPLFLHSLLDQDMLLAGALIFIYCALTIIGTLVSDLLLVALDPRIRLE